MAASYVSNIVINGGADFNQTFDFETTENTPLNLTGYTAYSSIKKSPASSKTAANFSIIFENRIYGKLTISLGSTITSTLKPGRYSYDILLVSSTSTKTRVVEGSAIVTAGITTV
jgi:hypothetical protein